MLHRRAGAPRLIEWTGERAVPWSPDVNVIYEHFHRYLWAQALVDGRRVMDVGSGEGYGSALLASSAREVVGIDVDPTTVEHSRLNYGARNLTFETASATDLSHIADDSFDAVVAFEILEHVDDQKAMLAEIGRVLRDEGLLIMSTPDRRAYTEATGNENPFHVHELSEEEYREALTEHFDHVCLFGQRPANGSRIEALDEVAAAAGRSFTLERRGDEWLPAGVMSPLYLMAVASRAQLPDLPSDSTLSDYGLSMLRAAEGDAAAVRARVHELEAQLASMAQLQADLAELAAASADAKAVEAELVAARKELAAACVDESRLNEMSRELAAIRAATGRPNDSRPLSVVVAELRKQANGFVRIQASRSFAVVRRYRRLLGRLAPAGSRRRSAYRLLTGRSRRA
jgi:SAM-dependent methyltransferase